MQFAKTQAQPETTHTIHNGKLNSSFCKSFRYFLKFFECRTPFPKSILIEFSSLFLPFVLI